MSFDPVRIAQAPALRVIKPTDRLPDVASGAMIREAAIAQRLVGAEKLWLGYVELGPGLVSAVHHHGEAESGIYIIAGIARFYGGDDLREVWEAGPGDFVWVPPHLVHVEMNTQDHEPVKMVVARSTQDTLIFNLPDPPGWDRPR
ncbi:MAG: hypothetical protein QOF51_908 [Chloroflexota bacterium]|jgi:uncharacterized RmlC-like cupin family protein|nr:hypothetical protein [Chloroflexota bacterium]